MSRVLRFVAARRILTATVVAVILAATASGIALAGGSGGGGTMHLTAYFTRTIGLYEGNDVRILGIKVGKIDTLTVRGDRVEADLEYDGKYPLPADVKAVVVPPSVVSDRYIQLTPAYTDGPTLPDGATLGTDRTAVPLEFDEIFRNLDQLNRALGPEGANKHGALRRLVDVSARNLKGNGAALNGALKQFSAAVSTLSGGRGDLFATVRQLQRFTTMLARNDGGIRQLNTNLAKVGDQLSGERQELGAALANLSTALQLVDSFVSDNRQQLTGDIHQLTDVTSVLAKEKASLKEIVDMAPFALSNLALAYDPRAHTLDTRDNAGGPLANPVGPTGVLCQLLGGPFCSAANANAKSLADLLAVPR